MKGSSPLIGFHDVTFLLSRASFSTIFLKNGGRGESLETATCPKTVAWGRIGHATCKILLLQQSFFLCHMNFMEIIRLSQS